MNEKTSKTALEQIEDILREFWLERSRASIIKAKHAELLVEPRVLVGAHINPEISKLLIREYLGNITVEDIARGKVTITSDLIMIYDNSGKLIAEVRGKKIIDSMINKITDFLGKELAAKTSKDGDRYVAAKEEGPYTFGDIKGALIEFLADMEKNDSKNLVKDAIILLRREASNPAEAVAVIREKPQPIKTKSAFNPAIKKKI